MLLIVMWHVSLGHRVVCIIVSNSSVNWLGDSDWHGWSQSPCSFNKIFCNSARKLSNWLLRWFVTWGFHFIIVWKRLFRGSGKPGKLREFHFAKFVSTLSLVLRSWYCLPVSSVANPKVLFLVSRKPSSPVFVLLTLFLWCIASCDNKTGYGSN